MNRLHNDTSLQPVQNNSTTSINTNEISSTEKNTNSSQTNETTSNEKKKIIPLYVNTLPKLHRNNGEELVNKLLTQDHITIDQTGEITSRYNEMKTINLENFLRSIFVKQASIKGAEEFFIGILPYIDEGLIVNPKLQALKHPKKNASLMESSLEDSVLHERGGGHRVWCKLT